MFKIAEAADDIEGGCNQGVSPNGGTRSYKASAGRSKCDTLPKIRHSSRRKYETEFVGSFLLTNKDADVGQPARFTA